MEGRSPSFFSTNKNVYSFKYLLISLWLGAIVFTVIPLAFDGFAPIKDLILVAGTVITLIILFTVATEKYRLGDIMPSLWTWVLFLLALWPWLIPLATFASPARHMIGSLRLAGLASTAGITAILVGIDGYRTLLRIWLVLGGLQAILVISQAVGWDPFFLWTGTHGTWQVYGTLGNPNLVAAFLIPLFFLCQWSELVPDKRLRIFALAVMVCAIVVTGSRAGAVILVLGLFLQTLGDVSYGRVRTRIKTGWKLLLPLGVVIGTFIAGAVMGKGFTSIGGRWVFWQAGWQLIKSNPWTGLGLGHFEAAYPHGAALLDLADGAPLAMPVHAHNDWLEFAVELGIIPALLFFVVTMWAIWVAWSNGFRFLALALGALTLQAGWDSPLHTTPIAMLFWMLLGLVGVLVKNSKQQCNKSFLFLITICVLSILTLSGLSVMNDRMQAHLLAGEARNLVIGGNWEHATNFWQKAWQKAPSEGEFAYWLSQGLVAEGDYTTALAIIKEAAKTHARFHLYMFTAKLEYNQGNKREAIILLEWLIRGFPRYKQAQDLLHQFELAYEL